MEHKNKIVFINPHYSSGKIRRWSRSTKVSGKDFECYPPLSLMYLAAQVRTLKNYGISIIDANASRLTAEELTVRVRAECPTVVGLTVTSLTLHEVYQIIRDLSAQITPRPLFIVGGPHITKWPGSVEDLGADYGFSADAEFALTDFLANLPLTDPERISGLIHRKDGQLVVNPIHSCRPIDDIPAPDRSLLDPDHYYFSILTKRFTLMITARGCPFNCIYCGVPHKREYSSRSVAAVIEEMKEIKRLGYEYINMCDDIFTLNRDRTLKLCRAIIEHGIDITWGCATRADVLDLDLLLLMKKAGCLDVRLGIEVGSERIRQEVLNKKISDQKIIAAVKNIKAAGLTAVGFFLLGVPGETKADIESTVRLACALPLDYASFNLPVPLPGARLYEIAIQENKIASSIWRQITLGQSALPVYVPDGMDLGFLEMTLRRAFKRFYLRPQYIFAQLAQVRSWQDLGQKINLAKTILWK